MFTKLDRPTLLTLAGVGLSIVLLFGLWIPYGDGAVWPGFAANLAGSLVAFTAALYWDRQQREQQRVDEVSRRAVDLEQQTNHEREVLQTEARRRLHVIARELDQNRDELDGLASTSVGATEPLKVLRSGAWRASAEPLSRILSDIELVADLSDFYERLAEVQWRLRWVTEIHGVAARQSHFRTVVNDTDLLVQELFAKLPPLVGRVRAEMRNPAIEESDIRKRVAVSPVGIAASSSVGGSVTMGALGRTDGPRG